MCPSQVAKRHTRAQVVRQDISRFKPNFKHAQRYAVRLKHRSTIFHQILLSFTAFASREGRPTESMSSLYLSLDSSEAAGTFMPRPWLLLAVVDILLQSRSVKMCLCAIKQRVGFAHFADAKRRTVPR